MKKHSSKIDDLEENAASKIQDSQDSVLDHEQAQDLKVKQIKKKAMSTQERAEKLSRKADEKRIQAEKEELNSMEHDSDEEDK